MWAAVIAAVAASSGNNIGKVLQKQATRSLPRLTLESKVVWTYLLSPLWVTGLIIDVGGGLLMLQAVASAPVSIVQPVSTSGLALMALFSHVYLHEPMRLADWTGILLCILGTVAVGVSSENPLPSAPPPQLSLRHLMAFVFWVVLLMAVLEWCATSSKAKRKIKDPPLSSGLLGADVVEELAAGTQAGAFFGLSAAAVKTGMLLATGGPPVFALLGIAVGISLSSFGFFCQTRGFKEGRAVVVSTCAAVSAMLTAVAAGMAGLGEDLPSNPRLRMWRFLGWSLILFGIVLLVAAKPPDLVGLAKADAARRKPLHPSPRAPNRSTSPSGLSIGIAAGFPRKYEP
ncbi:hypothetical protein CLOM_g18111 [Closterium sp. NIES-68]|nr:hypothetical protein CLOM_g18111 [Closterium sp. NIES-68]GJP72581.1 hypothetical protein CLOP_g3296 [Closterium sp. NIES-67]